jgi:hypothetical protein
VNKTLDGKKDEPSFCMAFVAIGVVLAALSSIYGQLNFSGWWAGSSVAAWGAVLVVVGFLVALAYRSGYLPT